MSTITKILKTAGVSALCNGITVYLSKDESTEFSTQAAMSGALTTLPALVGGVGIDKFVNQSITSNKPIQYGLTAIESALILPGGISLFLELSGEEHPLQFLYSNKTTQYGLTAIESSLIFPVVTALSPQSQPLKYFENLFSPSFEGNCGDSKLFALSTMAQSLAFKYIWDSSDEAAPELNKQTDSLELNTEIDQQVDLI